VTLCSHTLWFHAPRGPTLSPWYICDDCNLVVSEKVWQEMYEGTPDEERDALVGQGRINWE
jgi:hypothetical protein